MISPQISKLCFVANTAFLVAALLPLRTGRNWMPEDVSAPVIIIALVALALNIVWLLIHLPGIKALPDRSRKFRFVCIGIAVLLLAQLGYFYFLLA